jgi:hypothetical protein
MQRMLTGGRLHVIASHARSRSARVNYLCRLPLSSGAAAAYIAPDPGSYSSDMSRLWKGPEFLSGRLHTRSVVSGAGPTTDVAYLCNNCGSVHEVESIRENLILDLRTAASYELSGQRVMYP